MKFSGGIESDNLEANSRRVAKDSLARYAIACYLNAAEFNCLHASLGGMARVLWLFTLSLLQSFDSTPVYDKDVDRADVDNDSLDRLIFGFPS